MMKKGKYFITLTFFALCTIILQAQDWPQYLGPDRNSTSPQKGVLKSWPETGPEVLWTVNVGPGYGGPVIKDGKVYLLDRDDKTGDIMRCFDLNTGKELWKFSYPAPGSVMFPGSRSVPIVDNKYVWSCGHNGDLYCIDLKIHKPVWNKNIWTDFGGKELPMALQNYSSTMTSEIIQNRRYCIMGISMLNSQQTINGMGWPAWI